MIGLTEHQRRLLDYLESFIAESGGIAPTFTQMMVHMDMVSKSGVHRLLAALEERGAIRRIPHRARAIEIIPQRANLRAIATDDLLDEIARRGWTVTPPVRSFHAAEIAHA
jgi:repressor LexA